MGPEMAIKCAGIRLVGKISHVLLSSQARSPNANAIEQALQESPSSLLEGYSVEICVRKEKSSQF